MPVSLGELAARFGCELIGNPDATVSGVASLQDARSESLTFLSNSTHARQLPDTKAGAVVLRPTDADLCPVAALLSDNPYATYARMVAVVCPDKDHEPQIHPTAVVADSARVAATAHLAPHIVIGERSIIGQNVYVGPGCVIGPDCRIDDDCRFIANVTLVHRVEIGARTIVHPGVVIGADGFGNAMTPEGWVKVPQVGGVRIGDDVEIGSNTTIDCGAIGDTVIENGVRIDNLCMIAHNVHIGAHSALAGMTGIAGSTKIGKRCMFAGSSGAVGHITICDDVIVAAKSVLTKDVTEPGTYAGNFAADNARSWAKQVARFRRLDSLEKRIKKLEK